MDRSQRARERVGWVRRGARMSAGLHRRYDFVECFARTLTGAHLRAGSTIVAPHPHLESPGDHPGHLEPEILTAQHAVLPHWLDTVGPHHIDETRVALVEGPSLSDHEAVRGR